MTTPTEPRTIWKYTLAVGTVTKLQMPLNAKVLTVQMQANLPRLWALVWPQIETEERSFAIYGSGWPIPADCGDYIATFQDFSGALVWHVFDASEVAQP
jgi:hypothetical protein